MSDSLMKIVLASASPRRSELLKTLGLEFEVRVAPVDELHKEFADAVQLCEANARLKATAITVSSSDALVLGADTLVTLDGRVFGKPKDLPHAQTMLTELSGRTHQVYTSVCLC